MLSVRYVFAQLPAMFPVWGSRHDVRDAAGAAWSTHRSTVGSIVAERLRSIATGGEIAVRDTIPIMTNPEPGVG
jgi:hypothetical protein